MAAGLTLGMPRLMLGSGFRSGSPNDAVNVAVIGLGSTTAVGGVGGRGHQLIGRLREIPGVKIVALCDADQAHLDREVEAARDHEGKVATYHDPREVFDDKSVDAVIIALPNHWHALATVWACQAGKDVYVEKPFSYNLWEGRQMVAAARKYGRMVQVGTQNRSSAVPPPGVRPPARRRARRHPLRPRPGVPGPRRHRLGRRTHAAAAHRGLRPLVRPGPQEAADAQTVALRVALVLGHRQRRDGEQWHPRHRRLPLGPGTGPDAPRAMSIGGRFAFHDCGETANTHIALLDFQPAPLICEVRNVSAGKARPRWGSSAVRTRAS